MNTGKVLTIGILLIGLIAASAAWWHNRQKGQQALDFWGGAAASMIRQAPTVELVRLRPVDEVQATVDEPAKIVLGGQPLLETQRVDISNARGLVHARQALISDASFDWETQDQSGLGTAEWEYLLCFSEPTTNETVRVALDLRHQVALDVESDRRVALKIGKGLKKFLSEQWSLQ